MGKDIPLGRIRGIKVGMDVTVFLMAALYTWVLATYQFPLAVPDLSSSAYWAAGFAGAMFLFLSLLVHEIGHALVARDEGIGVESMGLTVLGGVTRMESAPTTPGAEFRVSVVGPIASAGCGVVFLVGASLLPTEGLWGLVGRVYLWVGIVNLFLAVINMIPAAPLDGGKVLSAAIWRATGNQTLAMTWAAGAGIVTAMAMLTYGIRELTHPDGHEDWAVTALIFGGFIGFSAYQQLRTAPMYRALEGLTVGHAMAADPPSAPSWSTVGEFLRTATPGPDHQAYPVVAPDGQVSGLLTATAIRSVAPERWDRLPVSSLAYPLDRITLVRTDEPLLGALQKVESGDVRQALVVGPDGRIVGTIDPSTLHRALGMSKAGLVPTGV